MNGNSDALRAKAAECDKRPGDELRKRAETGAMPEDWLGGEHGEQVRARLLRATLYDIGAALVDALSAGNTGSLEKFHAELHDPKYLRPIPGLEPDSLDADPTALKPCPFCGGEAEKWDKGKIDRPYVQCLRCSASTDSSIMAIAVRHWNARAARGARCDTAQSAKEPSDG